MATVEREEIQAHRVAIRVQSATTEGRNYPEVMPFALAPAHPHCKAPKDSPRESDVASV